MNQSVEKASPETATIIANIMAQLEQLKQLSGAGESVQAGEEMPIEDVEKILKEIMGDKEDEEKEKPVEKAVQAATVSTEDEGTTASSDAKEIIEDQGDVNEDNISEVAKSIARLLLKNRSVKKSAGSKVNEVVKTLAEENKELKKSVENIYEALGITEQIKKLNEVKKAENAKRIENDPNEIQKSVDHIKTILGIQSTSNAVNCNEANVHKSLTENDGELLRGLFASQIRK